MTPSSDESGQLPFGIEIDGARHPLLPILMRLRERGGMAILLVEQYFDFAQELEPTSRLSCQIKVNSELDGLVVRLPKSQH